MGKQVRQGEAAAFVRVCCFHSSAMPVSQSQDLQAYRDQAQGFTVTLRRGAIFFLQENAEYYPTEKKIATQQLLPKRRVCSNRGEEGNAPRDCTGAHRRNTLRTGGQV